MLPTFKQSNDGNDTCKYQEKCLHDRLRRCHYKVRCFVVEVIFLEKQSRGMVDILSSVSF